MDLPSRRWSNRSSSIPAKPPPSVVPTTASLPFLLLMTQIRIKQGKNAKDEDRSRTSPLQTKSVMEKEDELQIWVSLPSKHSQRKHFHQTKSIYSSFAFSVLSFMWKFLSGKELLKLESRGKETAETFRRTPLSTFNLPDEGRSTVTFKQCSRRAPTSFSHGRSWPEIMEAKLLRNPPPLSYFYFYFILVEEKQGQQRP